MRIIAGEFRRRNLHSPKEDSPARPMPDLVREAVFNLLRGHTENEPVFDGFAGSGSIGLEAISRGASKCVFVEFDKGTRKILERNIEHLGVQDRAEVVFGDALGPAALNACPDPVHLIFFDPPYAMVRDPERWPRVRKAFSRLVQKLDPTGYAILRLPFPFLHVVATRQDVERDRAERQGELDTEEVIVLEPNAPKHVYEEVDISIPGAIGPESHDYGQTAIHLYMKDQSPEPAGD